MYYIKLSWKMIGLVLLFCVFFFTTVQAQPSTTLSPNTLPPYTRPPPSCFRDGKYYQEGEHYQPSPCEWCECVNGEEQCAIADCFFTECVDSIRDPTQCCPVCPSGRNCYAGDKVISAGSDVPVDEYTTCRCPEEFNFGIPQDAVCTSTATTVPPK